MDLISNKDLATKLGCSVYKIAQLVKTGMPCVPLGARTRRYRYDDCVAWLAKFTPEKLKDALERANPALVATRKKWQEKNIAARAAKGNTGAASAKPASSKPGARATV